jgi:hypothetical protein
MSNDKNRRTGKFRVSDSFAVNQFLQPSAGRIDKNGKPSDEDCHCPAKRRNAVFTGFQQFEPCPKRHAVPKSRIPKPVFVPADLVVGVGSTGLFRHYSLKCVVCNKQQILFLPYFVYKTTS